jgi:hypothetical protein
MCRVLTLYKVILHPLSAQPGNKEKSVYKIHSSQRNRKSAMYYLGIETIKYDKCFFRFSPNIDVAMSWGPGNC